jgi:predicted nucleic acid-binding protein
MFVEELHLFAPEFLLDEFSEYKEIILEKTSRPKDDFERILDIFSR